MKFFLPKQQIFFALFKELDSNLKEIAKLFKKFSVDFCDFADYAKKAKDIEHVADDKNHQIIDCLNKTFITPLDREDIYLLAHQLDDIIDLIENVIHNIHLYGLTEKKDAIKIFAKLICSAAEELGKLMKCIEKQKYTKELNDLIVKLNNLEDQGDLAFQNAITDLFKHETDPIAVIKWKEIFENLEEIMDKFQATSIVIEGIIVKST